MRKTLFFVVLGLNVFLTQLFAERHVQLNDYVSLQIEGDEYIIQYKSPYFELRNKEIQINGKKSIFSQLVYGDSKEVISQIYDKHNEKIENKGDIFDYTEGFGLPEIPFFSLFLQIPNNSKVEASVVETQYCDINAKNISGKKSLNLTQYHYVPSQLIFDGEENHKFQFDKKAYGSGPNLQYRISEPEGFLGSTGITFTFYPFIYNPSNSTIKPIASATYKIKVKGAQTIEEMMDYTIKENECADEYTVFYDNYEKLPQKSRASSSTGDYLIITTNKYVATLGTFINHKSTLGYQVTTKTFPVGESAVSIRNYLLKWHRMYNKYPKYTLIVGNYTDIPFTHGVMGDSDNPPTDIYYACLEKEEIGKEKNFYPETIIGRWPVKDAAELRNIINKTIAFENLSIVTRRFSLFSGTGDGETSFASDITKAYNKIKTTPNSTAVKYDGRNGFSHVEIINEFYSYNDLVFIYRGHGSDVCLGNPYSYISTRHIPTNQSYFTIGLACSLNYPADNKFGNKWINNGDRACGIYGSTTSSYRSSNSYLSKHLFDYYTDQATNMTWGQWMSVGAAKYYSALPNSSRKIETEKYVLLGDPSLYLFGFNSSTWTPYPYKKPSWDNTTNLYELQDEEVEEVTIYDKMGHTIIHKTINESADISTVYHDIIDDLMPGLYILSVRTTSQNIYSTKICK